MSIPLNKIKEKRKEKPLICKNCRLYNKKESVCSVVVLESGEKLELITKPNDPCMWEYLGLEVQEIRVFSDGKNGYIETKEI